MCVGVCIHVCDCNSQFKSVSCPMFFVFNILNTEHRQFKPLTRPRSHSHTWMFNVLKCGGCNIVIVCHAIWVFCVVSYMDML